jgi:MFS family permease
VEDRRLRRLVSLTAVNGLAIGLTGPLIAYWFSLRFGVGPGLIAPMMAAGFALTAVSALVTGRLSRRLGLVRSVVWARSGALAGLVILPLVPVFWLASVVQVLRSALGRGSLGARQALVVSLVEDERRGLAVSVNAASFQLPQAVGPTVAGSLIGAGHLALPFYLGALLQAVYLVGYARLFRDVEGASAAPS